MRRRRNSSYVCGQCGETNEGSNPCWVCKWEGGSESPDTEVCSDCGEEKPIWMTHCPHCKDQYGRDPYGRRNNRSRIPVYFAHRYWIANLQEGDMAPDFAGRMRRVSHISYKNEDVNGRLFVGYATEFGDRSTVSNSVKEGEVLRTVPLTNLFKSYEVQQLDRFLNATAEAIWTDGWIPEMPPSTELYLLK